MKQEIITYKASTYTGWLFDTVLDKYYENIKEWEEDFYSDVEYELKYYTPVTLEDVLNCFPNFLYGCDETYPTLKIDLENDILESFYDLDEDGYYSDRWASVYKEPLDKLQEALDLFQKEKDYLDKAGLGLPCYDVNFNKQVILDNKEELAQSIYKQLVKERNVTP